MRHSAELFSDDLLKSLVLLDVIVEPAIRHPIVLFQEAAPVLRRNHIGNRCYKNTIIVVDTITARFAVLIPTVIAIAVRILVIAILIFQIPSCRCVVLGVIENLSIAQAEIDCIAVITVAERKSIGIGNVDISV